MSRRTDTGAMLLKDSEGSDMQQKEWKFGAHSMRQEAPDVIHAIYSGPISLDEMKRAVELYGEFGKNGPYYLIAEIAQSQLGAESRRYLSENGRADWFKGAQLLALYLIIAAILYLIPAP